VVVVKTADRIMVGMAGEAIGETGMRRRADGQREANSVKMDRQKARDSSRQRTSRERRGGLRSRATIWVA
jgi:hypothetical protein